VARILQIVNRLNLGGITYNAASITARLRPEHETMLVAGMKDDQEESSEFMLNNLGLEAVYIPDMRREINLKADYKAYKHLLKIIREFKPDVVHTHAAKAGILGRLAARRAGVKVIVHTFHGHVFHSYFGKFKTRFFLEIERFLARLSHGIIAISELQKKELCEIYKVCACEKIHIVELGYDLYPFQNDVKKKRADFRNKYDVADDVILVGMIGRLVPIKNITLFIDCWKDLVKVNGFKIKAFIIGDGEQRFDLQEHCRKLGLKISTPENQDNDVNLVFTSWIHQIDWAMAGIDILALTSLNEGTPASLIEAQAAGKPIVSSKVGGIANIVIEGETAFLVEAGDKKAFTQTLQKLIQDADLRDRMKLAGPQFALNRFHYQRLTEDIRTLYNKLLKHSSK